MVWIALVGCVITTPPQNVPSTPIDEPDRPTEPSDPPDPPPEPLGWVFDTVDVPPNTVAVGWHWRDDVQAVGGLVATATDRLVSQELEFWDDLGPLWWQDRVDLTLAEPLVGTPQHLYWRDLPVDVVVTRDTAGQAHLRVFDGDEPLYDSVLGEADHAFVDTWLDGDVLAVATCGTGVTTLLQIDLATGVAPKSLSQASDADRCVLVAPDAGLMLLEGHEAGGDLVRWRIAEDAFVDRLVLSTDVEMGDFASATTPEKAWFAALIDGQVLLLDTAGRGSVYGRDVTAFALAVDEAGTLALATAAGSEVTLTVDVGSAAPGVYTWTPTGPVLDLALGLAPDRAGVAVWNGDSLQFARHPR